MHDLIQTATAELAGFLLAHLPVLGDDWWTTHVEEHLSFQQQRMVQERGLGTLDQLDFAALLRVFDRNWYELSQALSLPREGRNWARELQTVRNKWAHLSAQTMPASDVYRDADTLGRFLVMLGAKREAVAAVDAAKTAALHDMAVARDVVRGSSAPVGRTSAPADQEMTQTDAAVSSASPATAFGVGDLVALRSNPGTVVPIIEVLSGGAETRYQVFQDNRKATYSESQLQHTERPGKRTKRTATDTNSMERMSKSAAIKLVNWYLQHDVLDGTNTHFSNVNSAKEVWWFNIHPKKFEQELHLLCAGKAGLIWFTIEANSVPNPERTFRLRQDKEAIDFEISCAPERYMRDVKSGGSGYDFRPHIRREWSWE